MNEVVIAFLGDKVRTLNERLWEALYIPVERRVLRRLVELTRLYPQRDCADTDPAVTGCWPNSLAPHARR